MDKTSKSALIHFLEKNVLEMHVEESPTGCAVIFDGMAEIQRIADHVPATFGELALTVLCSIVAKTLQHGGIRAVFLCDWYIIPDIKDQERRRRYDISDPRLLRALSTTQKTTQQFRRFLQSGKNKESLSVYLFPYWSTVYAYELQNISVFVTHGENCHLLSADNEQMPVGVQQVEELHCDHEEADMRMLLLNFHDGVIIRSSDTDVFCLSLSFSNTFCSKLYLSVGVGGDEKILDIKQVHLHFGSQFCEATSGFHAFTGCDTVSSFRGKGKMKPLTLMQHSQEFIQVFQDLGKVWEMPETVFAVLEEFVCRMYGQTTKSVDQTR